MTIKRKIVKATAPVISIEEKQATGFIDDVSMGDIFAPVMERITDDDAWSLYLINDWVASTVNRLVTDATKNRPVVSPIDTSVTIKPGSRLKRRIESANKFLFNPNDNKESFTTLRKKALTDLLVFGRGAHEKNVDDDTRKLEQLWSIKSRDLRINSDSHGNMPATDAYQLRPSGRRSNQKKEPIDFDIDEIIFMVRNPISSSHYGIKTLDFLAFSVSVDILRNTWNGNQFVNGAQPAALVSLLDMNKRDMRKFRADWRKFKGANNAHKTAFVNTKIGYQALSLSSKDMEFSEYGRELRDKIFAAYGVQPMVMGITDSSSRLNASQQMELYKENGVKPLLDIESDFYTREILHMGLGFRDLEITFPSIDIADNLTQSMIDGRNLQNAKVTVNELRRRDGEQDVAWGNAPVIILPGGGQIDPNTGQIVSGKKNAKFPVVGIQWGGQNQLPNQTSNKFEKYMESTKIKVDAIISSINEIEYKECKVEERIKPEPMRFDGKIFDVKRYNLPVKFKECQLDRLLNKATDMNGLLNGNENHVANNYVSCVVSRIKYIVVSNIINGTPDLILDQIDKIKNEEILNGPAGVIFSEIS